MDFSGKMRFGDDSDGFFRFFFLDVHKMAPKPLTPKQLEQNLRDPSKADWSGLDPKDVRVSLGPALTEEQMIEYCRQNGIAAPSIIRNKSR